MSAAEISSGQSLALASAPTSLTLWARSGECGPLISGASSDEVDLDHLVVEVGRMRSDLGVGPQVLGDARRRRRRSPRARWT